MKKTNILILVILLLLSSCVTNENVKIKSLELNGQPSMNVGDVQVLTLKLKPTNATSKSVVYSSLNENIASVDATGKVSAISVGKTKIKVQSVENIQINTTFDITVLEKVIHVESIVFNGYDHDEKKENEWFSIFSSLRPITATNQEVEWTISDNTVAKLIPDNTSPFYQGVRTLKPGHAIITVTTKDGNKKATFDLIVNSSENVDVTSVNISENSLSLNKGESFNLQANVIPLYATNKTITWSSDNASIASVSSNGTVIANQEGTTIIRATSNNNHVATCNINVSNITVNAQSVSLNYNSFILAKSGELTLVATVSPSNVANNSVTWSSDNPSIATVSNAGVVKAIDTGRANIIATTVDGGHTASCAIEVKEVQVSSSPIIANHEGMLKIFNGKISEAKINAAKSRLRVGMTNQSHGAQIYEGMLALDNKLETANNFSNFFPYKTANLFDVSTSSNNNGSSLWLRSTYKNTGGPGDVDRYNKNNMYYEHGKPGAVPQLYTFLDSETTDMNINVAMFVWCKGLHQMVESQFQRYLTDMNNIEAAHPEIVFIYVTGHLPGTEKVAHDTHDNTPLFDGSRWYDRNLKRNNEAIRQYCQENNKVLYDFADIESYNLSGEGNFFTNNKANDRCGYEVVGNKRNWAQEWQTANPNKWFDQISPHTESVNGNQKAYAFWWLLTEIADKRIVE